METERHSIALEPSDSLRGVAAVEGGAASPPIEGDPDWQGLSLVTVTNFPDRLRRRQRLSVASANVVICSGVAAYSRCA